MREYYVIIITPDRARKMHSECPRGLTHPHRSFPEKLAISQLQEKFFTIIENSFELQNLQNLKIWKVNKNPIHLRTILEKTGFRLL